MREIGLHMPLLHLKGQMQLETLFRGRVQRLISDLESAVTHVLALLSVHHGDRHMERTPVLLEDEF